MRTHHNAVKKAAHRIGLFLAADENVDRFAYVDIVCFIEQRQIYAACQISLFYNLNLANGTRKRRLLIHKNKPTAYLTAVIRKPACHMHTIIQTVLRDAAVAFKRMRQKRLEFVCIAIQG